MLVANWGDVSRGIRGIAPEIRPALKFGGRIPAREGLLPGAHWHESSAQRFCSVNERFYQAEGLMKPGTSALFVLDNEGDMDVILHAI